MTACSFNTPAALKEQKRSPAAFKEEFGLSVLKRLEDFAKVADLRLSPAFVELCYTVSHRRATFTIQTQLLETAPCRLPVDIP